MSKKQIRNVPASIRSKLLQLSKQRGEDYNYLLIRYVSDILLYRLSQSPYQQEFILKGATLFRVWNGEPHRATKDIDLLGFGANDISSLVEVVTIIKDFLMPPCVAMAKNKAFSQHWYPSKGWQS